MRDASHSKTPLLKNEKGFALLLSLLIVFLLVVIIFEADFQIRADLRAAGNFRDDLKADYLSRSGIAAAEAQLIDDVIHSNDYDGLDEFWAFPVQEYPLGDGTLSGVIVDEERKINLNFLVNPSTRKVVDVRKAQLERLFELLELNPELVDPIVDWVDGDDEALPYGAESSSYLSRDPSYDVPNENFKTLSELHMIQGITDEIYQRIIPYLTIYGDGRINVNTINTKVLQSIDEGIDETEARRLTDKRPFEHANAQDFKKELPEEVDGKIRADDRINWFKTRSKFFLLESIGQVNDTLKTSHAIVERIGKKTKLLYFRVD